MRGSTNSTRNLSKGPKGQTLVGKSEHLLRPIDGRANASAPAVSERSASDIQGQPTLKSLQKHLATASCMTRGRNRPLPLVESAVQIECYVTGSRGSPL